MSLRRFVSNLAIGGRVYPTDEFTNIPTTILSQISQNLHKKPNHPISLLKTRIESHFHANYPGEYLVKDSMHPVVSTKENFDDLLFPKDHPGRSKSDTYYVNRDTVLRTHTSAHQMQVLQSKQANGYLLTADVYRRDQIDSSHYPIFHQMEGIRLFNKTCLNETNLNRDMSIVQDNTKIYHKNPVQPLHSYKEANLVGNHLKATLESLVKHLFSHSKDLKIRWVEGYFPFTSPSWEMEVWYNNEWLELCGCGVIQQEILKQSQNNDKIGWAFGLGLERIAMFLYQIPDIRLFWSKDPRFTDQFKDGGRLKTFKPYSKYPACYKDISFWCTESYHENDIHDVVRNVAGEIVESVTLIDQFVHPKTKKVSRCYRILYRSMERTLNNEEIDVIQEQLRRDLAQQYGVALR